MRRQLRYNLQFFAEPEVGTGEQGIVDQAGLNGLLEQMDSGQVDDATIVEDNQTPPEGGEGNAEPEIPPQQNKANQAFAQMRTKNALLSNTLHKLAQSLGIEGANEDELIEKLNSNALEGIAQKQNIPVELLRRMEQLEQDSVAYQQTRLKDAALLGFQQVKDKFGLDDEGLQTFAMELDEKGLNPFAQQVDVIEQYKMLHFDDIIQRQVEQAVQAALSKDAAANQHSSTPLAARGTSTQTDTPINTQAGLNALLSEMK